MYLKPDVQTPDASPEDQRVGHLLGRAVTEGAAAPRVALIGFPSDEGVRRNGGRPGAASAPDAIRRALWRLTPDAEALDRFASCLGRTTDLGNLPVTGEVEADQQRLGEAVAPLLAAGVVPVVLGGGHETSFGHFLGYVIAGRAAGILNWDAHPDVRPLQEGKPHSGSPFRQALEHPSGACTGYVVAGLLPHAVTAAHLDWLDRQGGRHVWRRDLTAAAVDDICMQVRRPHMVSFDMDAVDAAWAPGVSAPAIGGMEPDLWLRAAYCAGRNREVTSLDLVEVNPAVDPDGRTARLAALTIWHFLRGIAERG